MTVAQLKKTAKLFGIKGYSKMNKAELEVVVAQAEAEQKAKNLAEAKQAEANRAWENWFGGSITFEETYEVIEKHIQSEESTTETLYRGGLFEETTVGQIIEFGKIASWTTERTVAEQFANGEFYTTDNKQGVPTIFVVAPKHSHVSIESKLNKETMSVATIETCKAQEEHISSASVSYKVVGKTVCGLTILEQL